MKIVADESVDSAIVQGLRRAGHDIQYIAESAPSISDDDVLQLANSSGARLITADKDVGELVFRLGRAHVGVALIRLEGIPSQAKAETVSRAFGQHASEMLGVFSVIAEGSTRIRPGKQS